MNIKRKPTLLALSAWILLTPAKASVVNDLDGKVRTYKNDGDGMVYIISGGKKFTWLFLEELRNPLGKNILPRVRWNPATLQAVTSADQGPSGLVYSRPLADGEIAQMATALIAFNEAGGAASLSLNPDADPGPILHSFEALQDKSPCSIRIYERATDICGAKFGRAGIVNWTMFSDNSGCTASGVCWWRNYKFSVGYQTVSGRKVVNFRFVNKNAAESFVQAFSSWGGSIPQRI